MKGKSQPKESYRMQLLKSPTRTSGLQSAYAIGIRSVFARRLKQIYSILEQKQKQRKEGFKEAMVDKATLQRIGDIIEKIKMDLSPITMTYIGMSWNSGNKAAAKSMKLGNWVKYDQRVVRALQQNAYKYLFNFTDERQRKIVDMLAKGMIEGKAIPQVAEDIRTAFSYTSWKSEQISRTEIIRTHSEATKSAIVNGGVTKRYKWLTSQRENVCSICKPRHGMIYNIDDPNAPMPVRNSHPSCNCGIVPAVEI